MHDSSVSRLTAAARQVVPWSIPVKLVIGAVLGALGSAGLLGYLTEYATYGYAIHFGIRTPLEGVPYLKATVAIGSIFLLISGAIVFIFSSLLIRAIIWQMELIFSLSRKALSIFHKDQKTDQRWLPDFSRVRRRLGRRPGWQIISIAIAFGILFAIIGKIEFSYIEELTPPSKPIRDEVIYFMGVFGFCVTLTMAKPKLIWWLAVTATAVNFLAWLGLLFSPACYSNFLRIVGYGGGFPVSIELSDESKLSYVKSAFLMIRTNESFFIYDADKKLFIEIPKDRVKSISHATGILNGKVYSLPRE